MSTHRAQAKRSSVKGSAAEKGSGNATEIARSTTQSSVSFSQTLNVSSSKVMTKKAVKLMDEQETNADTERMENRRNRQFLDAFGNSPVFAPIAGRATGFSGHVSMNSSRKLELT